MKALHAGYVSGTVWNAVQNGQMSTDLNWRDVIGRLSHFVTDHDVGGNGVLPPELSVLENLLCRGLPTLPSLYVERQLHRLTKITRCVRVGNRGVAAFESDVDPTLGAEVGLMELFGRAMCAVSPGAIDAPSAGFEVPGFESEAERQFYSGPLRNLLGAAGMQLVVRQRHLNSMGIDKPEKFDEQRTDFAIQFPGSGGNLIRGLVFEVDGPHHQQAQVTVNDSARDDALCKIRWARTYRHRLWKLDATGPVDQQHAGVSAILRHPYLARIRQNQESPLDGTDLGRRARLAALFPFAVSRIQRVLLELVRGGVLSLDSPEWTLVVVDRDGLSGCGRTAAIDFRLWLRRLWALYQPGRKVPGIRVYEVSEGDSVEQLPGAVDAVLDISVQLRYGLSLPAPHGIDDVNARRRVTVRSDYWKTEVHHQLSFGAPLSIQLENTHAERHLVFFLRNVFRKAAFRPKQVEIIARALRNQSVIALLPTGAGKSITYQLPSLLQNGISIVVDPIKSLMKDQDDNLKSIGITASAFINSMSTSKERRLNTELMQDGCFKFVFVSPERFIIREFRDALVKMGEGGRVFCAYAVVDEAHCVSEWGHDFRTAYLRLGANARRFCPTRLDKLPLLGLTGTASYEVLDDVHVELGYAKNSNIAVWPDSMERPNLHYRVVPLDPMPVIAGGAKAMAVKKQVGEAKLSQLPALLRKLTGELKDLTPEDFFSADNGSGLVFCPHAKWVHGAESACGKVKDSFPGVGARVGVYHGKLADVAGDAAVPIKTQNEFKQGKLKILACTKAFGMGIDKPDIRFTLHFNIPPSLESFYQEAGRAGRDNEDSQCWILYAGTPMAAGQPSLDYTLNHEFHINAFPGAEIEMAKVFEMLSENRTPGRSVPKSISSLLFDETGTDYFVKVWAKGDHHRIYFNHPEYDKDDVEVYIGLTAAGGLSPRAVNPFPGHEDVTALAVDWLKANKPDGKTYIEWVFDFETPTVGAGIEDLMAHIGDDGNATDAVCLSFDNGYLEELADKLGATLEVVGKAFSYNHDVDKFLAALKDKGVTVADGTIPWVKTVFTKVRLREHTFRAIYRLTVLGAVSDYEADYKSNTVTAWLSPQPAGGYREKLKDYIERYAPMDVDSYLDIADKCNYKTELRRCLYALIQFVYARIAKQRIESLRIMEQTTKQGLVESEAFSEAVTTFFDSKYIPILRPYLNNYTSELVFEICRDTAGGGAQITHLLGACNRLLPENPDNAAFHALRAYALALLSYKDQDVRDEVDAALAGFERYYGWGRKEKLPFMMKLRTLIATVDLGRARVFDAVIIEDHTLWLHNYQAQDAEITLGEVTGQTPVKRKHGRRIHAGATTRHAGASASKLAGGTHRVRKSPRRVKKRA